MSPPLLFDHGLRAARRLRAEKAGWRDDVLMPRVAEEMAERLLPVLRDFPVAVDLSDRGPEIAEALRSVPRIGKVLRAGADAGSDIVFTNEALPFAPESIELAV
jgi:hypothetical protein